MAAKKLHRYVPTIGEPDWNIKQSDGDFRNALKGRLRIALLHTEEEYQRVISYLYSKFLFEMDLTKLPDGSQNVPIQWNYRVARNKCMCKNSVTGQSQDMYAFVVYDAERDMEPIAFAGSYFKLMPVPVQVKGDALNGKYARNESGQSDPNGAFQVVGHGYVMFVDPHYRRLGLAVDLWWAEARLYREALNIRMQMEIQNEYSLKSTQGMFSDPSKCIVTYEGRLKNDGTRSQIRCLLDYEDQELVGSFDGMLPGLRNIYGKPDWRFLEREAKNGMTLDVLNKIWSDGKWVQ